MKVDVVAVGICGGSLVAFVGILLFFLIKINLIKKAAKEGTVFEKCTKYFWGVMASAIILIILPVLIPLKTSLIAVICACSLLAEIIAFRERLLQLIPKDEECE